MLTAGTEVGRYVVESVLGEGAMAVVYRVKQPSLGTTFALKVLTLNRTDIRERFVQEGRVQAGLRHPNVVSVFELVDVGESPGLVLEFVEGRTLSGLLHHEGRLPLEHAEAVFRGIVSGVAAAHKQGIVHRDLKPANVLVTTIDGVPYPKVADFGLAKIADADQGATRTGTTMGTPSYMAPEQIRDAKHVDARADVFALGAILYELVTGKQAFPGDDVLTVMTAVNAGTYVPPRTHVADLPERFVTAIDGALKVDPAARFASCEALLAALRDPAAPRSQPPAAPAPAPGPASTRVPTPSGQTSAAIAAGGGAAALIALIALFAMVAIVVVGLGTVWSMVGGVDPKAPCGGKDGEVVGYVNHRGVLLKRTGATWVLPAEKDVYAYYPVEGKPDPGEADVVCHLPSGTKVKLVESPVLISGKGAWAAIAAGSYTVPEPAPEPAAP